MKLFLETSLKPLETFWAIHETFETPKVSKKFHEIIEVKTAKTVVYKNHPVSDETCQVSSEIAA